MIKQILVGAVGFFLVVPLSLKANPVTVQELGIGANEVVTISSSPLGNGIGVYAGIVNLSVDGLTAQGFCIDPFHFSVGEAQHYSMQPLSISPKSPGGPMGDNAATQIAQLWKQYFSPTMGNEAAAGLQIAIWELVAAHAPVATPQTTFRLDSGNDYGAASMLAWVEANAGAPLADLVALSGPGQDYVISVPDGGFTVGLLGAGFCGLSLLRRRFLG